MTRPLTMAQRAALDRLLARPRPADHRTDGQGAMAAAAVGLAVFTMIMMACCGGQG